MRALTPRQRLIRVALIASAAILATLPIWKSLIPSVPCGFKALTGLPCLFCGGTRAACAALRGDFEHSLYLNALSIPLLIAATLVAGLCACEILRGRPLAHWHSICQMCVKKSPILLVLILIGWIFHVVAALETPKPELLDSGKLIAARLRAWLQP